MTTILSGKTILITGVTGSIGSELLFQIVNNGDDSVKIIGIDNNESELFFLQNKYKTHINVNLYVCDIREIESSERHFENSKIIFHCAALKHVGISEISPEQAVLTNIIGTQNVIRLAKKYQAERVLFTSSDKAVNPTNVMGTTKLMGERLMTAANMDSKITIFSSTRFGNVLGSNGSVVPIFKRQLREGNNLTVTHPDMTRFIMSKQEAVGLVLQSAEIMRGGEVFVTKMPVMNIEIIAKGIIKTMSRAYGRNSRYCEIEYIGVKPGEKLYEELMSTEEMQRSLELEKYFVILPALRGYFHDVQFEYEHLISETVTKPYNSMHEECLDLPDTIETLTKFGLLDIPESEWVARDWPGDK